MEGLMMEATDLILSSNKNFAKDLNKYFTWERRRSSPDINDASSIALLRISIAKSLKERSESEVIESFTPKRRKSRRRKGSFSGKPKVDVQLLHSDIDIDNDRHQTIEQNKFDAPEDDLTTLFTEEGHSEKITPTSSEINQANVSKDVIDGSNTTAVDTEKTVQPNPVQIGLKLAQRHFSDSIFESCSTYSLTCPDVLRERGDSSSFKGNFSETSKFFYDKAPELHSDVLHHIDDKKSEHDNNSSDDQISLTDSFFGDFDNSGDNSSQNSFFSKSTEGSSVSRKSSIFSASSKENEISVSDELKSDTAKQQMKSERKLSKKERKRQKRTKSIDVCMYECPKCSVSYVLSNNAPRNTARCLHCDLWKSVEPVFVKREKQPWNTCRIC